MLALAITISAIVLIALLRFGVIMEYNDAGFILWVKVAFARFKLLSGDRKKKSKKKEKKAKSIRPGSLSEFISIVKAIKNALIRMRRRLLIKQLTLYYTAGGDDPSKVAILYGTANAVFGAIIPVLEKIFRIKRRDLQASLDYSASEQGIYAKIIVSIAVWEVIYVVFALFPIFTATARANNDGKESNERKD